MVHEILIVDGYNIIGAWPDLMELSEHSLEDARDELISRLADYQGFSGMEIIVVFDAHQVPGLGKNYHQLRLDVRYTKEKETADECIERLVYERLNRRHRIHVATSDSVEQHVIFGKGALRMSARELYWAVEESRKEIRLKIKETEHRPRNSFESKLSTELKTALERLRRGK